MRKLAALLWLVAAPALSQSLSVQLPGGSLTMQTPVVAPGNVSYQPSPDGVARIQAQAGPGVAVQIFDGPVQVATGGPPAVTAAALPGRAYTVRFLYAGGYQDQTVVAQPGMFANVFFGGAVAVAAPPPPPVLLAPPPAYQQPSPPAAGMDPAGFAQLVAAIEGEAFHDKKVDVLRTAASGNAFSCEQVGQLLDLYAFHDDKVKALRITRPGLVDPQNSFTLYSHLPFESDKKEAHRILGN